MKKGIKLLLVSGLAMVICLVGAVIFSPKAHATNQVSPWIVLPDGHYDDFCGTPQDPLAFQQFNRCANLSYYLNHRLLASGGLAGGRWIWPLGHDGTPTTYDNKSTVNITSADGSGAGDMSGFINVIWDGLNSAQANVGLAYLGPGHPCSEASRGNSYDIYGNYIGVKDGRQWCEEYAATLIGSSYIINTMLGKDANDPDFNAPDRRIAGIQYAKDNFDEWADLVRYYAIQPLNTSLPGNPCPNRACVDWVNATTFPDDDPQDPVINGKSRWRTDTVVYRDGLVLGLSNPDALDAGSYVNNGANVSDRYVKFYNADGTFFLINKNCGNITGPASPLTRESQFAVSVNPNTQLQDAAGTPDREAAFKARFSVTLSSNTTPLNNIHVDRNYYVLSTTGVRTPLPPNNSNDVNFPLGGAPNLGDQVRNLPAVQAGDQVCVEVTVRPARGIVDTSGAVTRVTQASRTFPPGCDTVENHPYVRTFGADTFAGTLGCNLTSGWPNTDVTGGNGGIYGSGRDVGNGANGSASQLALLALGPILDYRSGAQRTTVPPFMALHFANTDLPGGSPANSGGQLGVSHCPTNFYGAKPPAAKAVPPSNDFNSANWADDTYTVTAGASKYTLPNGNGFNKHIRLYVDGDLVIANSVSFNIGPWASTQSIPRLTVIVRGNIYISSNVSRLDGVFIAQGTDVTTTNPNRGGTIYTCSQANGALYPNTTLYANCDSQLVVNGALVANRIKFLRTFGSTRDSKGINERPAGAAVCSNGGTAASGSCAAEVINYTPEVYMAPPEPNSPGSGGSGTYDYIVSPPPLF